MEVPIVSPSTMKKKQNSSTCKELPQARGVFFLFTASPATWWHARFSKHYLRLRKIPITIAIRCIHPIKNTDFLATALHCLWHGHRLDQARYRGTIHKGGMLHISHSSSAYMQLCRHASGTLLFLFFWDPTHSSVNDWTRCASSRFLAEQIRANISCATLWLKMYSYLINITS